MRSLYKCTLILGFGFLTSCSNNNSTPGVFTQTSVNCEGEELAKDYIVTWKDGTVETRKAESEEEIIKDFVKPNLKKLVRVEHDFKIELNLPSSQNELDPLSSTNWGQEQVRAYEAWDDNITGDGVLVAVVDSGVDINHSFLRDNIFFNPAEVNGRSGVDDDNNGYVDDITGWNFVSGTNVMKDYVGHGTHVSGVIASEHSDDKEIGIAPNAKILPVAFLSENGGRTSDAIAAIRYSARMGAKVINASWGGSLCSQTLLDEIKKLNDQNILIMVAAGNSGSNISIYPEYPASFNLAHQITVGASTSNNYQAGFSNFGPLVDLVAPGDKIYSTYRLNGFQTLSGTSMATPFVSGIAALLWSAKPSASADKIKSAILNSVIQGPFNVKTRGIVDVPNALKQLN